MNNRIAWRASITAMGLAALLLLGACTAQTGNVDEHGLRPHLNVDLQIPKELNLHQDETFTIKLTQGGKPATAEFVTFEFWPEGQPEQKVSAQGAPTSADSGVYTAQYAMPDNGIYVVRCLVTSGSMEAMPAKRFAMGEKAVLHLAEAEKQESAGNSGEGDAAAGHHHH